MVSIWYVYILATPYAQEIHLLSHSSFRQQQADQRAWKEKPRAWRTEWISGGSICFFRCEPSEVRKEERLKFISKKTDDGRITGRIGFYCKALEVARQAFYDHLSHKNTPWKYQMLADEMMKIHEEDQYNDCYGRERMYLALQQRKDAGMLL